jgi:hypothetical protein
MKMAELMNTKRLGTAAPVITVLGRFKTVFTVSSLGYCAVHWLVSHNFSIYVFTGALAVGGLVATAGVWISRKLARS